MNNNTNNGKARPIKIVFALSLLALCVASGCSRAEVMAGYAAGYVGAPLTLDGGAFLDGYALGRWESGGPLPDAVMRWECTESIEVADGAACVSFVRRANRLQALDLCWEYGTQHATSDADYLAHAPAEGDCFDAYTLGANAYGDAEPESAIYGEMDGVVMTASDLYARDTWCATHAECADIYEGVY